MKDILINGTWYENLPDIVVDTIIAQDDHIKYMNDKIRTLNTKEHTAIVKRTKPFRLEYYKARQELYSCVPGCSYNQGILLQ